MSSKLFSTRGHSVKRTAQAILAAAGLALLATNVHAQTSCQQVVGHYVERIMLENCLSPVGLCIAGEYGGVIKGSFDGMATSLTPSDDTPTTGVVLFTSDSVIHASMRGKQGDLLIKNAGAYRTIGDGDIVDVQVIVGGTGELAGASGVLQASGVFVDGSGESEYIGSVCLP
jgi:hypothetical protein